MDTINFRLPRLSKPRRNVTPESDSESDDDMLDRSPLLPSRPNKSSLDSNTSPVINSIGLSHQIKQESIIRRSNCFGGIDSLPPRRLTISQEDAEISSFLSNGNRSGSSTSSRAATPMPSRPMTPDMRRVLRDSLPTSFQDRPATPFVQQAGRVQCLGTTMKGQQCRNAAVAGTDKCRMHN